MFSHTTHFILIILYSLTLVSCNPSLNGLVTINDNNDQMQEESSSYLHFARIPDEEDARKIILQMANQSIQTTSSDDLDLSASANMAQILTNVNDNEQRTLQQQLQTNEDPLQKILPRVRFDCKDRKEGYYSDPDFNCEVFHYCKSNGYRFTLVCPIKSRYSMKAMTCVYEDHKFYECPGLDSLTNASTQTDAQTTTMQSLTSELNRLANEDATTTNASIADKNDSLIKLIETNKMSTWTDIINRSKYVNNNNVNTPTQLNNNDIMESLNQITTTLSSRLNVDIGNSNANYSSDLNNSSTMNEATILPVSQFGTRFNAAISTTNSNSSSSGKNRVMSTLKKMVSSPGYEDLRTKYTKRKKYKTTTMASLIGSLDKVETGNLSSNSDTESVESVYTTQSSLYLMNNSTLTGDKGTYQSTESSSASEQIATSNDQSINDNNHLNHHNDYKEINDQSTYQFTSYQTSGEELVRPIKIKIGQLIGNDNQNSNLSVTTHTFNGQYDNQFDQSTDSGFKPIFRQTTHHQQASRPGMSQFKFVNSQLSITGGKGDHQIDSTDNTISASSTSNPVLFTGTEHSNASSVIVSNQSTGQVDMMDKHNQTTLLNDLIKNDSGYQTRENYRLMVQNVSDQKLKDFIKNNDLIDISSTAISTAYNSPTQIVPQFLKEKRSRIKNENSSSQSFKANYARLNNTNKLQSNNMNSPIWPQNAIQFKSDKAFIQQQSPQFANYWPNLNYQNLNKQYNSYTLDTIATDPAYQYDYVFGLSKVLPSINANFPPFLPDKNFILKYPSLFADYYSPVELQAFNMNANNKAQTLKKLSSNQQDKTEQSLPGWLKSKFTLKSPINRNTNSNTNNNPAFANTNHFLHSAASSSFNYPLYELPPPSLIKQQQHKGQQQSAPIAMPLISPTGQPIVNTNSQQLTNLLNSPLMSSQLMSSQLNAMPTNSNLMLNGPLIPATNTPQTQQQNLNSNTRKTFFSQLSRLFSSASIARPVRVPYTAANLASAFSTLTQPFSKLQIDNLSNQLFSPFKGFLNATTSYIPIRKENPIASSSGNKNNNDANASEEDELDELEKQILNANGISPYTLNPQTAINQPIAQSSSNLVQPIQTNALNFNSYNHQMPLNSQSMYGPIKRSSTLQQQQTYGTLASLKQSKPVYSNSNHLQQVRSLMLTNKPTNEIHQQTINNPFLQSSLPILANNRHDLMHDYILENDDFVDEYGLKRGKKRRKRNIVYDTFASTPTQSMHYSPKYTYPFIAPFHLNAPFNSLLHSAYGPSAYPTFYTSPHHPSNSIQPIINYATPVLPSIIPAQFTPNTAMRPSTISSNIMASESQFKSQSVSSISPTPVQSLSTLHTRSQSSNNSASSSFGSLASAASQLAVSLTKNIENMKSHKNIKIRKHLSKLASSSSNFLPTIGNFTTMNAMDSNKTMAKEQTATATVYTRPPGKSTYTTWSFSTLPINNKDYAALSFVDFPYFSNQFNANSVRNLPLPSAYLMADSRTSNLHHHPFNGQFNAMDLNSLAYHTALPATNNYPLPQLPKLHIQYRPANPVSSSSTKTKTSGTVGDNLKSNIDDIDETYGRRKVAITAIDFRDLLNAYKQTTNQELYMPIKATYSANEAKEGQLSNNEHSKQYAPDYGFPKSALLLKSKSTGELKESAIKGDELSDLNYHPQASTNNKSSKYQSQSSNNRLVKQQLSSSPKAHSNRLNDVPRYRDEASEFDLQSTNQVRKDGKVALPSNYDDDDDLEDDYGIPATGSKQTKNNHIHGGRHDFAKVNSNHYKTSGRTGQITTNKSMNRNLKSYPVDSMIVNLNRKKADYSNNYHETNNDEDFFRTNKKMADQDRIRGRQSNDNFDRDSKASNNSDDYEDNFFDDEQSDGENEPSVTKSQRSTGIFKSSIKHSTGGRMIAPKSSKKSLFGPPSTDLKLNKDDEMFDENGDKNSNFENDHHIAHHQTIDNSKYSNRNQLNFQTANTGSEMPRSIVVKTSSYSFEIPNHSENEDVEFDSDHIGKQPKRPSYTLEQPAVRKSVSSNTDFSYTGKSSIRTPSPVSLDYELKTPAKFSGSMIGRSNFGHSIPHKRAEEKPNKYSTDIEHSSPKRPNSDNDESFNRFEIRRQPNLVPNRNHHLPHSHIEDVEAFYKAAKKSNSKGKFRQFFHQQQLKHTGHVHNSDSRRPTNLANSNTESTVDMKPSFKLSSSKNDLKTEVEDTSKESKFVGSPVSKAPRIYFNWHSNIDHSGKKHPAASTGTKVRNSVDESNDSNDELSFDTHSNVNSNLYKSKLNNQYNHDNLKGNFEVHQNSAKNAPTRQQQQTNHLNNRKQAIKTKTLDDDWFKQDWLFKDLKELNTVTTAKTPEQENRNSIKNVENSHNSDNNEIDSGDVEYEDDVKAIPVNNVNNQSPSSNQPLNNRHHELKNKENVINAKTKLQVMDQQNKQYTPTTTTSSTTQSPKITTTTSYKAKFLSSSKFAERQKFKNSLKPTTVQPAITTTTTTTTIGSTTTAASKEQMTKKHDYQKAKLINLQFKKDSSSGGSKRGENGSKLPFTRTIMKQHERSNDKNDKANEKSDKAQSIKTTYGKAGDSNDKKVIVNSNLQNSSSTLNAQILDKLPISVDSIFDTIDEENEDYEGNNERSKGMSNNAATNALQNKQGDLLDVNVDNSNESNENSLNDDDLTTNLTSNEHTFGSRITGNGGKLQPKVSIKASYSSVSSTVPRAMAQKMDTQKVDSIGFRSLDSDELNLKKESNGLFKNRMKQFKKQNWLSPLTSKVSSTTSAPLIISKTDLKNRWKGFDSKQQKIIEQKKSLDDKSAQRKSIASSYLDKFRKNSKLESKESNRESIINNNSTTTTTLKSTSTTVPTTTSKSIERTTNYRQNNQDKVNQDRFKSLNRFKTVNSTLTDHSTSLTNRTDHSTTISPQNQFKTNYNLSFNNITNTVHSISNNMTTTLIEASNNSSIDAQQAKPYRRIFSAFSGGAIQHKLRT